MTGGRFLGIDYGAKRIGIAASDSEGVFAFPKAIAANDSEILLKLEALIRTEQIQEIVIGESLDLKGNPNAIAKDIEHFIEKIKVFGIPVHREKEFLTSVEARRIEHDRTGSHVPGKKIDASAAALILQRYLDRKNKKSYR